MSALSPVALLLTGLAACLLALGRFRRHRTAGGVTDGRIVLLFEGEGLVDTSGMDPADRSLAAAAKAGRMAVIAELEPRFTDLATYLGGSGDDTITLTGSSGGDQLLVERWADFTRLTLTSPADAGESLRIASLEGELRILRTIAEDCPQPIWKADATGRVVWANRAYLDLADRVLPVAEDGASPWPIRPLFAEDADIPQALTPADAEAPLWFDITQVRHGDEVTGFATDATRLVAAETGRKAFVQTLSRTFADLRTGLAVFDRQRRLVLFNPAFPDLTGLGPDFLARRPHVRSVLGRLRDAQILPEPRDWTSWRNHIATLQLQAEEGTYCENWSLPDGRTYRITGRPHPDGALAFFIEDISDEVTLNRHLRLGQEAVQTVLDQLPQAIAVFSEGGSMTLCNTAYAKLWNIPPSLPEDHLFTDELARWRGASAATPLWEQIADALASGDEPTITLEGGIALADGRAFLMRLAPMGAGRVMAEFRDTLRYVPRGIPIAEPRIRMLGD